MTDKELKQLVESNARAAQAMLDSMAEARLEREELRKNTIRLDNAMMRLTQLQEGVNKMLASLDEDRPTVFKKLNSIEDKIDRLLQQQDLE